MSKLAHEIKLPFARVGVVLVGGAEARVDAGAASVFGHGHFVRHQLAAVPPEHVSLDDAVVRSAAQVASGLPLDAHPEIFLCTNITVTYFNCNFF